MSGNRCRLERLLALWTEAMSQDAISKSADAIQTVITEQRVKSDMRERTNTDYKSLRKNIPYILRA